MNMQYANVGNGLTVLAPGTDIVFKFAGKGQLGTVIDPPIHFEGEALAYNVVMDDAGPDGSHAPGYTRVSADKIVMVVPKH